MAPAVAARGLPVIATQCLPRITGLTVVRQKRGLENGMRLKSNVARKIILRFGTGILHFQGNPFFMTHLMDWTSIS
jgi:hypothetical protein